MGLKPVTANSYSGTLAAPDDTAWFRLVGNGQFTTFLVSYDFEDSINLWLLDDTCAFELKENTTGGSGSLSQVLTANATYYIAVNQHVGTYTRYTLTSTVSLEYIGFTEPCDPHYDTDPWIIITGFIILVCIIAACPIMLKVWSRKKK